MEVGTEAVLWRIVVEEPQRSCDTGREVRQALVSEKEIQKKEEGTLYSSELDSEGWAGHRAEPLGAATSR